MLSKNARWRCTISLQNNLFHLPILYLFRILTCIHTPVLSDSFIFFTFIISDISMLVLVDESLSLSFNNTKLYLVQGQMLNLIYHYFIIYLLSRIYWCHPVKGCVVFPRINTRCEWRIVFFYNKHHKQQVIIVSTCLLIWRFIKTW